MRGVEITKEFDLRKIKLDLSKQLNDAGRIIRLDHTERLESGLGVNGERMTPLKENTIIAKGSDQILVDTGQMKLLEMKRATRTKQVVEIFPGRKKKYKGTNVTSADVGKLHQTGTSRYTITPKKAKFLRFKTTSGVVYTKKVHHPGLPKREWFGISKKAEKRGIRMVELYIDKQLKNA
jgi:hypothetical protein